MRYPATLRLQTIRTDLLIVTLASSKVNRLLLLYLIQPILFLGFVESL